VNLAIGVNVTQVLFSGIKRSADTTMHMPVALYVAEHRCYRHWLIQVHRATLVAKIVFTRPE
jgi:hypothetical protein